MKKILSVFFIISLLLLVSCAAKTESKDEASYYKTEDLTEAERFVNENKLFPDEYIGYFDSDSSLERREFAALLYKLAGEPDVEKNYKLIQTDEGAFYYDACMFTACNGMTFDIKIKQGVNRPLTKAEREAAENADPQIPQSIYIDDIKIPYAEVVYGLYNYAKYAALDCGTEADFNLIDHGGAREIDIFNTQCFKKQLKIIAAYHSSIHGALTEDVNDCYAWAVNFDIIEADNNGIYEIEREITHGEFAEIMQRFYTNVLNV